jgi:integrase
MATFRQREGRWQAIIRRVDLRASKTFARLIDAKTWARALERDADLGKTMPGKMLGTLEAVIDRYEKDVWKSKRWGPSKTHELSVLRRDLGNRPLSALSQSTLLTYLRGLKITGGGIASRLSYLREVLKTARDLWDLRVAIIAFAESQERAMIDLAAIVRVLSVIPLRVGELVGIEWSDLNRERRTAILRSRKHPDIRVREMNDQEVPLIAFGGVDTFALVADRPGYLPSPFPYKVSSVSAAFHFAALRCQIVDLHLHDLRAHALSSLLEAGVPIPQVALISGHKNWKTLAKHYARIDPVTVHEAVTRAQKSSGPGTRGRSTRGKATSARP